jgi:hypothetical protein
MSALSKIEQLREFGGRLPQGSLTLGAGMAILALVAFAMPKSASWHSVSTTKDQVWAGHLEAPVATLPAVPGLAVQPLTSASYTSGFDKAAFDKTIAAPAAPNKEPQQQVRDPNACPTDLNCAFRMPAPRSAIAAAAPTPIIQPMQHSKPNAFTAFASRLRPPRVLLQPFTFVADTFTGLIKKL